MKVEIGEAELFPEKSNVKTTMTSDKAKYINQPNSIWWFLGSASSHLSKFKTWKYTVHASNLDGLS